MVLRRILYAALCALAALPCGAQQGGGFGGAAGASIGRGGDSDLTSASNILTPGQRSEWALTVKEGETVIAHASTTNFDPALQIVDDQGKVLAENDDIELGVQDARVLFRFPKAGSYKVLVSAFKGAGGGQFKLNLRRFVATEIKVGERITGAATLTRLQYYRVPAAEKQTLLLRTQSPNGVGLTVFSPTGATVELTETKRRANGTDGGAFRSEQAGDYYVRVSTGDTVALTIAAAFTAPLVLDAPPVRHTLAPSSMDIWTFEGKEGDFLRITARGTGSPVRAQLTQRKTEGTFEENELVEIEGNPKAQGELVVFLRTSGTYEVKITQAVGLAAEYTLSSTRTAPTWGMTRPEKQSLKVGASDFYWIEGKAGEILSIAGNSDQFDLALHLFDPQGELLLSNDDGGKERNALLTTLLARSGKYLLQVHSFEYGGGGSYELVRAPDPVHRLKLGQRANGTVGAQGSDIWSYSGKAGQSLILSVRSTEFDTQVRVFGPDGIELAFNDDGGDGTNSLLALTLPLDGTYTFWVSGKGQGSGSFTLRLLEAE